MCECVEMRVITSKTEKLPGNQNIKVFKFHIEKFGFTLKVTGTQQSLYMIRDVF